MNHLTDEQMIDHHFHQPSAAVEDHLKTCPELNHTLFSHGKVLSQRSLVFSPSPLKLPFPFLDIQGPLRVNFGGGRFILCFA